jgi:hypothetical protein
MKQVEVKTKAKVRVKKNEENAEASLGAEV